MTTPGEIVASLAPWVLTIPGAVTLAAIVGFGWWLDREIDKHGKDDR